MALISTLRPSDMYHHADMKIWELIWVPIWNYPSNIFMFIYNHLVPYQYYPLVIYSIETQTCTRRKPQRVGLCIHAYHVMTCNTMSSKTDHDIQQSQLSVALCHCTGRTRWPCNMMFQHSPIDESDCDMNIWHSYGFISALISTYAQDCILVPQMVIPKNNVTSIRFGKSYVTL